MSSAQPAVAIERVGPARDSAGPNLEHSPFLRHPLAVMLLATALWGLTFAVYTGFGESLIAGFIAVVLIVVAATDLERRVIPNRIILPATALILVAHLALTPARAWLFVVAAVGAGVVFLIPNLISGALMGMGDVKLATFLGAGLGLSVVGAVTVAFASVFPVALGFVVRGGLSARKSTLPFGPFLAFGSLVILIVPRLVGLGGS
jgi:prepilin signal peptidase PulO-like enzyme (type II secretory pathway)